MAGGMKDVANALSERWKKLTCAIEDSIKNTWWTNISLKYSEPNRKYHNLVHLHKMFQHMDSYIDNIEFPDAVAYAIFFHDLEYDLKSQSNQEDSVNHFHLFAKESGLDQNRDLVSKVEELIIASGSYCIEEHKKKDSFGQKDIHFFLDFDVSILGSNPLEDHEIEYKEYTALIRKEYSFLSDAAYDSFRIKVLKSFLQIPNVFATKPFRDQYEVQARINMQEEISHLSPRV